jgi:hypothetical protein
MDKSVEIASLSQLVRLAVHAYIRGETQPAEQPTAAKQNGREALGWGIGGDAVHAVRHPGDDKSLWVGVVTMAQIETNHAQRRYTTLLGELECQVGRDLF